MTNQQERSLREQLYDIMGDCCHAREIAFADGLSFIMSPYLDEILSLILAEIDKAELTVNDIAQEWTKSWKKQDTRADLDDEEMVVLKDILRAQLDMVKRML